MMLTYPQLPADILQANYGTKAHLPHLQRLHNCTAQWTESGRYPLDEFYKSRAEAKTLAALRRINERRTAA